MPPKETGPKPSLLRARPTIAKLPPAASAEAINRSVENAAALAQIEATHLRIAKATPDIVEKAG